MTARLFPTLCLLLVLCSAGSAPAAPRSAPPAPTCVLLAESISWRGFVKYWSGYANRADRVVLIVALVGGLAFFIIARGKWR